MSVNFDILQEDEVIFQRPPSARSNKFKAKFTGVIF